MTDTATTGQDTAAEQLAETLIAYRDEVHKLKAVLQLLPLPVFITHSDGKLVLYVNPAYTFFLGGNLFSIQNHGWLNHWCAEDRPRVEAYWHNVVTIKKTLSVSGRYVFPPGEVLKKARITATVLDGIGIIGFVFPEICWDVQLPIQIVVPLA